MGKKDYQKQKEYRENMTDEKKQKIKDYQKQYIENMTDEERQKYKKAKNKRDRDRYNKMTDEEKQKHQKNIKTCWKNKSKKEKIIKNNISKIKEMNKNKK